MVGYAIRLLGLATGAFCLLMSPIGQKMPSASGIPAVSPRGETGVESAAAPERGSPANFAIRPAELTRAERLFKKGWPRGDLLPAIKEYTEAIRAYPKAPWVVDARWRIAQSYQRMRHYYEAAAYWKVTMASLRPGKRFNRARTELAECLFHIGRLEEAENLFRLVSREWSETEERIRVICRLGDCAVGLGREQDARSYYDQAASLQPKPQWIPPESLFNMAELALSDKDYKKTAWMLMTALSLYPEHPQRPRWLYLLGDSFLKMGKRSEGAFILGRLKDTYPEAAEAKIAEVRLSAIQAERGQPAVALAYGPAPDIWTNPRDPIFHLKVKDPLLQKALLQLGRTLIAQGELDTAFRVLLNARRGLEDTGVMPMISHNLQDVARFIIHRETVERRYSESIHIFDAVSRWLPRVWNDGAILLDIGLSYEKIGFLQLADLAYERIIKSAEEPPAPETEAATLGLLRVSLRRERFDRARDLLARVSEQYSWKATAEGLLQWAADSPDPGIGERVGQWLQEIQTGNLSPQSLVMVGRWLLRERSYENCAGMIEGALAAAPQSPEDPEGWKEVACLLGEALAHLGKTQGAIEAYQRILNHRPWGWMEKWAAYRALQVGLQRRKLDHLEPYLVRLLQEPEGSLWRNLADVLQKRMRFLEQEEGTVWS
jgi:tetratricopeptide (TPR) repeat protein